MSSRLVSTVLLLLAIASAAAAQTSTGSRVVCVSAKTRARQWPEPLCRLPVYPGPVAHRLGWTPSFGPLRRRCHFR